MPTLDAETENALRWQVDMWHEVGALMDTAMLDATEYGILRGVVLPAIAKRVSEFGETSAVGRWWRNHTPAVVRKALSWTTNVMAFVLDHPWVQWMGLWLAKILRMIWCLSLFGVSPLEMEAVKSRITKIIDVRYHHPLLSSLYNLLLVAADCVTLKIGKCLFNGFKEIFTFVPNVLKQFTGHITDIMRFFMHVFGLPGKGMFSSIETLETGMRTGDMSLYEWGWDMLNSTGLVGNFDVDMIAVVQRRADGYVQPLLREMRFFYNKNGFIMGGAFVLWFMRRISVQSMFNIMDRLAPLFPRLANNKEAFKSAILKFAKLKVSNATAYDLFLIIVNELAFIGMLRQYFELLCIISNVLGCAVVAVFRRIPGFHNQFDVSLCCTQQILKELEQVKSTIQPKIRQEQSLLGRMTKTFRSATANALGTTSFQPLG